MGSARSQASLAVSWQTHQDTSRPSRGVFERQDFRFGYYLRPMFTAMLMFFLMWTALAPRIPLVLIAPYQFVSFYPAAGIPPFDTVVFMHIRPAIHPTAPPGPVVYENAMSTPVKPAVSPAP